MNHSYHSHQMETPS